MPGPETATRTIRRFTGWHMFAILCAFFGVVIAVNIGLATLASTTFSGLVVENSYVASQQFNHWLDEAASDKQLGWKASVTHQVDGRIAVSVSGSAATPVPADAMLTAEAWRPLGDRGDYILAFTRIAAGSYVSTAPLAPGRWRLRLRLAGASHVWHGEELL